MVPILPSEFELCLEPFSRCHLLMALLILLINFFTQGQLPQCPPLRPSHRRPFSEDQSCTRKQDRFSSPIHSTDAHWLEPSGRTMRQGVSQYITPYLCFLSMSCLGHPSMGPTMARPQQVGPVKTSDTCHGSKDVGPGKMLGTYHGSKDVFLILFLQQQKHVSQQDSEDICRDQNTEDSLRGHVPRKTQEGSTTMLQPLVPRNSHPNSPLSTKYLSLETQRK